jgi:ornithine cyclodeaminase
MTAVGVDDPSKRGLDIEVLRRARVFVDERATSLANGDAARALAAGTEPEGLIDAELGEVLTGRVLGRRSSQDISLAKFVGIGAQDLLAAERVLQLLD